MTIPPAPDRLPPGLEVQADEIEGEAQQHDAQPRGQQVGIGLAEKGAALVGEVDHGAPGGVVEVPEAEEAQGGLHHDAAVHAQQEAGDQDVVEIGQDVPQDDVTVAVTMDRAILDKGLAVQMDDLGPDAAGGPHPAEGGDQEDQVPLGASQEGRQDDQGDEPREQDEHVDQTVEESAGEARAGGQGPHQGPEDQGQHAAHQADEQRVPGAVEDLGPDIIAQGVGAQQVLRTGRQPGAAHLLQTEAREGPGKQRRREEKRQQQQAQRQGGSLSVTQAPPPI